jgi:dolichyl-diphosphooligosaccharide---protein glycosyltransferase subunit 4
MITDDALYSIAIFLGSVSMVLIVVYHLLEVNSKDTTSENAPAKRLAKKEKGLRWGDKCSDSRRAQK